MNSCEPTDLIINRSFSVRGFRNYKKCKNCRQPKTKGHNCGQGIQIPHANLVAWISLKMERLRSTWGVCIQTIIWRNAHSVAWKWVPPICPTMNAYMLMCSLVCVRNVARGSGTKHRSLGIKNNVMDFSKRIPISDTNCGWLMLGAAKRAVSIREFFNYYAVCDVHLYIFI